MIDSEGCAYIQHARHLLGELESSIHDVLTGRNDLFVKTALLQDVAAIALALGKALI